MSGAPLIKKRSMTGLLSHARARCSSPTKIRGAPIIKKFLLWGLFSHFAHAGQPTHTKISGKIHH